MSDSDPSVDRSPSDLKEDREKLRWMLGSTTLNALLAAGKLSWGFLSGSTVVLADAVHSLSDVFGALLVYGAVRLAPHRSARFPYGLFKLEDFAAVLGGVGVLVAGYEILRSVFTGIQTPATPLPTLVFMAAVVVAQSIFYVCERKAARRLESPGLRSDVINWAGDIGASLVVIVGIVGHSLSIPYAQEIAVVVIVALVFHGAWGVLRDGILSLLDASPATGELDTARRLLESLPAVASIRSLRIRRAGSALFLDATLVIGEHDFWTAHDDIDSIERELKEAIPHLDAATIHYEPKPRRQRQAAKLYEEDRATAAESFGKAAWIEFVTSDESAGETIRWMPNPFREAEHGKAVRLAAWLITQDVDKVVFSPTDPASSLIELLAAAGIEVDAASN